MPAVSKKQFKFMQAIAHGAKSKKGKGLSPEEAKEYVSHNKGSMSYDELPESKKKFKVFKRGNK